MTKPTKWVCAQWRLSLGIRPVWSECSLCAQWVAEDPRFLHVDSEDSGQTGQMPRRIWVFVGRTAILLVLSWGSSFSNKLAKKLKTVNFISEYLWLGERYLVILTHLAYIASGKKLCSVRQQFTGRKCVMLFGAVLWWHPSHWPYLFDFRRCNVRLCALKT